MLLRAKMWFFSLLESVNGGKARRAAEWEGVRTKNAVRVEAGRKSWETRRRREAQERAQRELDARADLYVDHEQDAVDVA